jgi:hypothetical protein
VPEQAHRKLTTHQKSVLIQVLLTFPGERVEIVYSPTAADAQAYATDFMAIFKAIGWDVSGPTAEKNFAGGAPGLVIVTSKNGDLPACAQAFRDALRIYEVEVEVEVESRLEKLSDVPANGFILWVGPQRQKL